MTRSAHVVAIAILLTLSVDICSAAACPQSASFAFSAEPAAKASASANHRFYVVVKGEGWYVGESVFASSGVPIVGTGTPVYTCSMAAGANDKGTRTADVVDEHGNTLVVLSGKTIDKDLRTLLAHPDALIPDMRKQAAAVVAKAANVAKKDPAKAKSLLATVAALKGWKEGDDARTLMKDLGG
jgi:hypothetical protein